jgi:hypothetical protein
MGSGVFPVFTMMPRPGNISDRSAKPKHEILAIPLYKLHWFDKIRSK